MHRVHLVFAALAMVAAGQELGATASSWRSWRSWPPPPPAIAAIRAYMGSVDYGGQPPSYARIPGPAFPVDRKTGAPNLVRPGVVTDAGGRINGGQQLDQNPGQQQPAEQPAQPGQHKLGFWEKLWHLAGDAIDTAKTGIHNTVAKTKSWFGK